MIDLTFAIDDRHLVYHTITGRMRANKPDSIVSAFQGRAQALDADAYAFLCGRFSQAWFLPGKTPLSELVSRGDHLIRRMSSDDCFELIRHETQEALERLRDEWELDRERTQQIMERITRLALDRRILVYVTHPDLCNGQNFDGAVFWSYWDPWPHYNVVYLWHEALHLFMPSDDTAHAVLELAVDNELRIQLNGGTYPPFEGHRFLLGLKERLFGDWQQYLQGGAMNVNELVAMVRR